MNDITFAFLLTIIAGTATGVGGLAILFSKKTSKKFLSICLSFSAGVMLYISFAEILLEAFEDLEYALGDGIGYLAATIAFFVGILLVAIIDKFIPHGDEVTELAEYAKQGNSEALAQKDKKELKRTGVMAAIAIAIHNLPEGIVIFMAAIHDPALGIAIALAIILHNIPEGIATAAPIYYSTGSRAKALLFAFVTGYVQPIGALIAWFLMRNVFDNMEAAFGIAFAAVAGIMVYVAIHQLLPAAQKFGKHHLVMKWLFAGMAVMAISLVALEFVF
ncbi:MAG: zinc transporter ZupT [Defluviitaleaceae bacterium]|nr:zinc transporter ZupT [Defluviitaleaceae bacterium]